METTTTWVITIAVLAVVILFDLGIAVIRRKKATSMLEASFWTVFYIATALVFGALLPHWVSNEGQKEFFAGWLTEYALSVDNIFVFIIILASLKVQKEAQQLVLLLGIMLTIAIRALLIPLGAALISRFASIFFLFGIFLIYTAWQLAKGNEEEEWKEGKVVGVLKKRGFSTFAIALVALGLTNLVFSLDSIPAIFGLTKDPYIVTTANVFALMGLRQLYFLLEGLLTRLVFLSKGLSFILGFIGTKMIMEAFHGIGIHDIAGVHIPEVGLELSLGVIIGSLAITTVASLTATRKDGSEII
ncbi:MAG: TerC family protein [Actinobacteria bacterium]|jgi:tellurite resistance protein TerC|nr:TerC family protein [Actinomycetota bacterium]NCX16314.1 TerC family protein [Actinomycetota bacterium]NCX38083.1 TerC family protein [Actinomycetota bacterium]NDC17308.1 TerC family protein [Actinomycetota bacterium]NDE65778.1 TerC family protein [Actinomycetota bacterium]